MFIINMKSQNKMKCFVVLLSFCIGNSLCKIEMETKKTGDDTSENSQKLTDEAENLHSFVKSPPSHKLKSDPDVSYDNNDDDSELHDDSEPDEPENFKASSYRPDDINPDEYEIISPGIEEMFLKEEKDVENIKRSRPIEGSNIPKPVKEQHNQIPAPVKTTTEINQKEVPTEISSVEEKDDESEGMYIKEKEELKEAISHELGFDGSKNKPAASKIDPGAKKVNSDGLPFSNNFDKTGTSYVHEKQQDIDPEPIPLPLTEEEIKMETLYNEGLKKVNSSHHYNTIYDGYQQLLEAAKMGHSKSKVEIAFAEMHGRYLPMNIEKAKRTFESEAEKGSPQAQAGLAFLYGTGVHTNSSQAKALIYLTFSALGSDTMGQMMLGYRYWTGIGVSRNCESALSYYRKVANEVASGVTMSGGVMIHRIRILDEIENAGTGSGRVDEDLVQYYQFLADKGDVQAQVGLGQLNYQGGRGFEQNVGKAYAYFKLAADANNANAQAYLGKMYAEGSNTVKQNNETALKYFEKATEQGNPVGQAGLGTMHLLGKGVPMDYKKAFTYFQLSADQGYVEGQLQLGNMYFLGLGVKRDYKQALRYFNLASQSGHLLAVYNLAQMHATGTGVGRRCHMAVELYKNVCERGRWSALFDAAYHQYQAGRVDSALVIYLMLAELGYEVAQSNVAHILDQKESNLLLNESYPRALVYWNRAASQGYTTARIKLGDYHYYGYGTEVDFETAASHYKVAVEQGKDAQATFNLGYMHEQGLGLKQDFHLAKRYYDLAAETSPDAQAPVMLALMKVGILYGIQFLKQLQWTEVVRTYGIHDYISDDWDIYVMTVVALLLGFVVAFRRQHAMQPQQAQR
uniref:protein sel-1 homolog 1-like n=1 Tax=Styela clava TaxID=7725 RepID=UPI00193976FE|nr:protein sel-1 homolog 1-like [Styela clava]